MTKIKWDGQIVGMISNAGRLMAGNAKFKSMWREFKTQGIRVTSVSENPPSMDDDMREDGSEVRFELSPFLLELQYQGFEVVVT